ncbi:MAG TPA: hypothetical protein VM576_04100 [Xanthomonadaceae bacterium]|nr:hypothetical protein [Xanthomonadaceae bacterium]
MRSLQPGRIALFATATAGCLVLGGHVLMAGDGTRYDHRGAERAERLAQAAARRFEDGRGLTPCDMPARELMEAAQAKLVVLGESRANPIVIVAPTFSEVKVVAFEPDLIRTYRFPGSSGAAVPSSTWFAGPAQKVGEMSMSPQVSQEIVAPLARHVRYAMTTPMFGMDGVTFYFGYGASDCAFTWSPGGRGPARLMTDLVEEASSRSPSVAKLRSLAAAIDAADESL